MMGDGAVCLRMTQVWRDRGKRFEHELALEHAGMWNGEVRQVNLGVAEQQDVEIDGAGAVADGADAA
ncbi:hypothetical protein F183_A22820 [Bryobacterales bacterium F-183]|nr:hypothetical protein F183_A22820 [Bryobacterales bacterium F-183]